LIDRLDLALTKILAKGAKMNLVKKAIFIPILGQTQFHNYANVLSNQAQNLVLAFSLRGKNASSFGKEVSKKIEDWQADSAQKLHQYILDLLKFCRDENLEIEFAVSLLLEKKIIFATFSSQIILKRNGQAKTIISSDNEIALIVGSLLNDDQIVLINQSAKKISRDIIELLNVDVSQEKLISQITIENSKSHNNNALAFVEYKTEKEIAKSKFNWRKFLANSKKTAQKNSKKIILITKKIINFSKKTIKQIKMMDKKKLRNIVLISLAVILIVFSFFSIRSREKKEILQNTESSINNILQKTANIKAQIETEPLTARQTANNSLDELEELKKVAKNNDAIVLIDQEIAKLNQLIEEISVENNLDQLSVAYNLSQKSAQFLGKIIKIKNKKIYVLENNGLELLALEQNNKQEIKSLKTETAIRDFVISDDLLYILQNGIKTISLNEIEEANDLELNNLAELKEEGESDQNGQFFNIFGPYLYLLNTEKRNIYRYYHQEDTLSDPIGWLINKEGISFDKISDFMVNGDLFLTFENGKVMKFEKGEEIAFEIQGLSSPFENPLLITGQEEVDKIAILEKKNKRLVIISSEGQVFSEIKSNELAAVSDIEMAEDGNSVFAISGAVVYQIKI
jgi:hypothetical protein